MEEVKLDSLFERRILQFEPPWVVGPDFVPGTPPMGYYPGSRARYRRSLADAAGYRIGHHVYRGYSLDSPVIKAWAQDLRNWFGLLPEEGKPSCLEPYVSPEQTWRYR